MLASLNQKQLSAVTHNNGSMLVLAGAGSGKTKVLTTRIVWLINEQNLKEHEVLAVTFSNKAAKEMLHRVSSKLSITARSMWIGTFHSISLRLLTKHHKEAGLPAYFQILDVQDQLSLLKRIIKAANLDEDHYSSRELQKFINHQKEHGLRANQITPNGMRQQTWLDLYLEYELICNRDGLVDFTELLLRSYEMLSVNKDVLDIYRNQFKHILVDEFQDTNHLQYQWLKLLGSSCGNMFAVGDDDQSIYSFRGARVANMQTFLHDFSVNDPIRMEQNYRSTPNILSAANAIIDKNNERIGKTLWTQKSDGDKISLYEGYTEEDEAYFVTDEIKSLLASGKSTSSIAILYRSNAQSRIFEQLFYSEGVPYKVYGGLRFFDRQEVKHILSYLRLILNKNDNEAFLRVVNVPARGLGSKAIENLQNIAKEKNTSLFEACNLSDGKAGINLAKFTNIIQKIDQKHLSLPDLISLVVEESGVAEMYRLDKKNGAERLENLNELVSAATNFKAEDEVNNNLATFLSHAVLESGEGQAQMYEQPVQLMTVHAAKGLEFDTVFIVGLEDGLFPHENCFDSQQNLEEERRLMYVAITRACKKLYLLRACSRLMWGKRISAPVSRFVNEIPNELILNISGISKIGCSSLVDSDIDLHHLTPTEVSNPETKISRVTLANCDEIIKIGDMVKHAKFGNGKVLRLNIDGKKITAEIFFIGIGKKNLDLNIAKIEKV